MVESVVRNGFRGNSTNLTSTSYALRVHPLGGIVLVLIAHAPHRTSSACEEGKEILLLQDPHLLAAKFDQAQFLQFR